MRTKRLIFLPVILLFASSVSEPDFCFRLSTHETFPTQSTPDQLQYLRVEKEKWEKAITKGAETLPEHVLRVATGNEPLGVDFFADKRDWITGIAFQNNLAFNLTPAETELPDWLVWEPFSKDGFLEEERLWVAIHEIGHLFDFNYSDSRSGNVQRWEVFDSSEESSPTLYGAAKGPTEDFAESFALYVMWPEHLKKFPKRYQLLREIFHREYRSRYKIPNSVGTKLVNKDREEGS